MYPEVILNNPDNFLRSTFTDKEYVLFKLILKDLKYENAKQYLEEIIQISDLIASNPEYYFKTDIYKRITKFRHTKSPIASLTRDLIRWPRFDNYFGQLSNIITKSLLTSKFSQPETTLREIERAIEIEECFSRVLEEINIDHSSIVNHLSNLYTKKKHEIELNQSEEPNEDSIADSSKFVQIDVTINQLSLEQNINYNTINNFHFTKKISQEKEKEESSSVDIKYNNIRPFPLFDLGENRHFIERIGEILNQRKYIHDFHKFYLLFNPTHPFTGQIDYVHWNNTSATLAYFFVLLLEKKVIASNERSDIPMCLERGFLYLDNENQYKPVESRSVQKEMGKINLVGTLEWAEQRKNKIYREIYRIISEIVSE